MTEQLLLDTAAKAFADTSTFAAVQEAQAAGWAPKVWEAAATVGLPWISVPEGAGGVGGTLSDAMAVLQIAGRYAAPIPLAETGLLAGWILAESGLQVGDGPLSVVPGRPDDDLHFDRGRLSGTAHRVPWGRAVDRVVALVGDQVVAVSPARATSIDQLNNVAGEPRDTLFFADVPVDDAVVAPDGIDSDALHFRGALSRAALMSGALQAMAEMTASYATERVQFGRPIRAFQAVQAHMVKVAEEAALVDLAVQVLGREVDRQPARLEIAAAKSVADDAARTATRAAHQVHGAMGMTQEYPLHQFSRRLWAWRAEYGGGSWAARIGQAALTRGPDDLYYVIADGSMSGIRI
jgi:acyl-CoA dehydrogenase